MKHNETPETVISGVNAAITALVVIGMTLFFALVGAAVVVAQAWQ